MKNQLRWCFLLGCRFVEKLKIFGGLRDMMYCNRYWWWAFSGGLDVSLSAAIYLCLCWASEMWLILIPWLSCQLLADSLRFTVLNINFMCTKMFEFSRTRTGNTLLVVKWLLIMLFTCWRDDIIFYFGSKYRVYLWFSRYISSINIDLAIFSWKFYLYLGCCSRLMWVSLGPTCYVNANCGSNVNSVQLLSVIRSCCSMCTFHLVCKWTKPWERFWSFVNLLVWTINYFIFHLKIKFSEINFCLESGNWLLNCWAS